MINLQVQDSEKKIKKFDTSEENFVFTFKHSRFKTRIDDDETSTTMTLATERTDLKSRYHEGIMIGLKKLQSFIWRESCLQDDGYDWKPRQQQAVSGHSCGVLMWRSTSLAYTFVLRSRFKLTKEISQHMLTTFGITEDQEDQRWKEFTWKGI